MRLIPLACSIALLVHTALAAEVPAPAPENKPVPGHSMTGEAFNEGPRQAAVLMEGTGDVHFPITTANPLAQKFFTQGVGQLHGFWYFEAERSFRQVAALDPGCAMAYWGMAMANINNQKRAQEFIKLAVAKKAGASRREQLWIDSLAAYHADSKKDESTRRSTLIHALENLSCEFPDDLEAKAFLVFQLWDNAEHDLPLPSRQAVDALAQQVLAVNPQHPIHHYLIHLWNADGGDKRALVSAAHCGQTAPGIAHMWHMSGHTFSSLHRYADAAWQQEASARVDHAYMATARIMPEQIHNYAHNNDWLIKNLGYIGRIHDAVDLAKNLVELPRLGPTSSRAYLMGRERLVELLVRYELWDELISLENTMYLAKADKPEDEAHRLAALGIAYWQRGATAQGEEKIAALEKALQQVRIDRVAAADAAEAKAKNETKPADQITKAMADALRGFSYQVSTLEAAIAEVKVYQALAGQKLDEAKALLEKARDIPSERKARIELALGDTTLAVKLAREATEADAQQVQPLANLANLLWQTNQPDAARVTFAKLRPLSANLDRDLPVFTRLAPIIADLKLPEDWRNPAVATADVGVRPALKSLGPFRWHPYPAPAWDLIDSAGHSQSLTAFRGHPVLVVFYLGNACTRCVEQLSVLAPLTPDFAAAGIPIVAISSDTAEDLHRTSEQAKDAEGLPFLTVSDASLATFKTYRVYDDFEHLPLHGMFLIDGDGAVRWQNISYQPFREITWLLGEARRLLSVPSQGLSLAKATTGTPAQP